MPGRLTFATAAVGASSSTERMRITSAGNVVINSTTTPYVDDKLYIAAGNAIIDNNKAYLQYTNAGARATVLALNSSNNLFVGQNNANNANLFLYGGTGNVIVSAGAIEVARFTTSGNVGIGTTVPAYKLTVSGGGIQGGGKITYTKSAGSLDTTGYAVAGLTTSSNGQSAGFTFTCFGPGKYQRIVYSCYNGAGTWITKKVIDEGTNDIDVEASANGSTITFTFKANSSTQSYTPRETVEAVGTAINSTYA